MVSLSKKSVFFSLLFFLITSHTYAKEVTVEDILALSIEEMMTLEIFSANKSNETITTIPASVYIVSRKDIENYGYRTLTDILENVPGMYNIYSYNGISGNFGVRGFWNPNQQNSSVVILVNGIHQHAFDSRSTPMEQITVPVEAIDRIEVIRGPNAVIYGNGASFGVINIITNDIVDKGKDSHAAYSYGSLDTHKAALKIATQKEPLNFSINAGFYKTDGLDNTFSEMMSEDNLATLPGVGVDDPDYSTKNLLQQENRYFNLSGAYHSWYFDMTFSQSESEFFILFPSVDEGTVRKTDSMVMTLGYKKDLSDWFDINLRGSYYRLNRKTDFDAFSTSFFGIIDLSYDAYDLELLTNIKPNDKTNLLFGLNYKGMSDLDEFTDIAALGFERDTFHINDRFTWGLFTQLSYQVNSQLRLVAGIRTEELLDYKRVFIGSSGSGSESVSVADRGNIHITSPRFAAIYTFNENNILKLMYGISSRMSDDNYAPEETETLEANYLYLSDNYYCSFSLFNNSLDHLLVPVLEEEEDGGVQTTEDTSGRISTFGTELILNINLTDDWMCEAGITYQETKDRNNNNLEVAYSPELLAHLKTTYRYKKTTFSLIARHVDCMESFFDPALDNGDGTFGQRVGDKVDRYTVLDANVKVEKIYSNLFLNLKANNVFDTEIRYPNNVDNNALLNKGTLGNGLEITATIGTEF